MTYLPKTRPDHDQAATFLAGLRSEKRYEESLQLIELMQNLSGDPATLWGTSIIGFGHYHYTYASGHSGTSMRVGFSPRKNAMTIYIMSGYENKKALLEKIGPHSLGKSCLYIRDMSKIQTTILEEIIAISLKEMSELYPI